MRGVFSGSVTPGTVTGLSSRQLLNVASARLTPSFFLVKPPSCRQHSPFDFHQSVPVTVVMIENSNSRFSTIRCRCSLGVKFVFEGNKSIAFALVVVARLTECQACSKLSSPRKTCVPCSHILPHPTSKPSVPFVVRAPAVLGASSDARTINPPTARDDDRRSSGLRRGW